MSDRGAENAPTECTAVPVTAVFGAGGFIGRALLAGMRRGTRSVGIWRGSNKLLPCFDLAAPDIRLLQVKKLGITHAVIAAGVSGVAACEREPAMTRAVNVDGTVELVRQLREEGIRVLALSSDYVFDGTAGNYTEDSPVNPLTSYGSQKADMERLLLEFGGSDILTVRLSKIFDTVRGSGTLLDEMVAAMNQGLPLRVAFDQYFCPTCIDDIVSGICHLLRTDHTGIVHLCAPNRINRLELAWKLADAFGFRKDLIEKISLHDLGEPFLRPLDTSMVSRRLCEMEQQFHFQSLDTCIGRLKQSYEKSFPEAGHGK